MQEGDQTASQQERKRVRNKFTPAEDETIIRIVNEFGPRSWRLIASNLPGRSARQIRERYVNYLSPKVCNDPWTYEEDQRLREKVAQHGRKWSKIAKFFKNRTDVTIKNRWSKLQRCDKRQTEPEGTPRVIPPHILAVPPMYIAACRQAPPVTPPRLQEEPSGEVMLGSGDLFFDVFDQYLPHTDFEFAAPLEWDAHF